MAWINTNKYRRAVFTVDVRENGSTIDTKIFDIRLGFSSSGAPVVGGSSPPSSGGFEVYYNAVTDVEFSRMTDAAYQQRLSAFYSAVTQTIRYLYPNLQGSIVINNEAYYSIHLPGTIVTDIQDVNVVAGDGVSTVDVLVDSSHAWKTAGSVSWGDSSGQSLTVSASGTEDSFATGAAGSSVLHISTPANYTNVVRQARISIMIADVECASIVITQDFTPA